MRVLLFIQLVSKHRATVGGRGSDINYRMTKLLFFIFYAREKDSRDDMMMSMSFIVNEILLLSDLGARVNHR